MTHAPRLQVRRTHDDALWYEEQSRCLASAEKAMRRCGMPCAESPEFPY